MHRVPLSEHKGDNVSNAELPPKPYRVLSSLENHFIGNDGVPLKNWTYKRIKALEPLRHITYKCDTDSLVITDPIGLHSGRPYRSEPGIYAVDLALDTPMQVGEDRGIGFMSHFSYSQAPPPVLRQFTGTMPIESISLAVCFFNLKLPAHVYWAEWDGYQPDSQVIPDSVTEHQLQASDETAKNPMFEVHKQLEAVAPGRVLGFYWEWE